MLVKNGVEESLSSTGSPTVFGDTSILVMVSFDVRCHGVFMLISRRPLLIAVGAQLTRGSFGNKILHSLYRIPMAGRFSLFRTIKSYIREIECM